MRAPKRVPGSRRSEVQYLARRFFDAAMRMRARRPGLRFVVPAMPALREAIAAHAIDAGLDDMLIVEGRSHGGEGLQRQCVEGRR